MTPKGILVKGVLKTRKRLSDQVNTGYTHWVALNCGKSGSKEPVNIGLRLVKLDEFERVLEVGGCSLNPEALARFLLAVQTTVNTVLMPIVSPMDAFLYYGGHGDHDALRADFYIR
jgi:hypothetical protein